MILLTLTVVLSRFLVLDKLVAFRAGLNQRSNGSVRGRSGLRHSCLGSIRYAQKTALVLNFMVIRVSKDMVSRSKYWNCEKDKGDEY